MSATLLIPNMHCPSCTSHISSLLEPFIRNSSIRELRTSLLDRTVSFEVMRNAKKEKRVVQAVKQVLKEEGGFEISSERDHHEVTSNGGFITHLKSFLSSPSSASIPLSTTQQQRYQRHLNNCEACQAEADQEAVNGVRSGTSGEMDGVRTLSKEGGSEDEEETKVVVEKPKTGSIREVTFSISGMTCSACVSSLTNSLKHPHIFAIDIDLLSASGVIKYDANVINKEGIGEMIDDTGFECSVVSDAIISCDGEVDDVKTRKIAIISIEGMTCSSCSSSIATTLLATHGVISADISVLDAGGRVEIDESVISAKEMCAVVEDAGYGVEIVDVQSKEDSNKTDNENKQIEVQVDGVFCKECTRKLDAHMSKLLKANAIVSFTPFLLSRSTSPSSPTSHIARSTVTYIPQHPHTVRSILSTISDVDSGFQASLVMVKSLSERSQEIARKEQKVLIVHFLVAVLFAIPTFIIAIVGMVALPMENPVRQFWDEQVWGAATKGTLALWPLATVVQFGVGRLFYSRAWKSLKPHLRRPLNALLHRKTSSPPLTWRSFFSFGSMDLLVVLSTSTSYFASVAMMAMDVQAGKGADSHMSYFDSSVFLIMFILGGRTLEAYAKAKTTSAISALNGLRPAKAFLLNAGSEAGNPGNGLEAKSIPQSYVEIAADHVDIGDLLLVRPGDLPPADGIVVRGESTFDESSLTGESRPVKKTVGERIWTGTINQQDAITIRVTAVARDTMVEGLISAMNKASARKAPIAKVAEKFTAVFTPIIIYTALIVLVIWLGVSLSGVMPEDYLNDGARTTSDRVFFSFQFAIAALVVSCPCGAGLATPTAQAVGSGITAQAGILTSGGGEAFQAATGVTHIVLDKTGTITTGGSMVVTDTKWSQPSMGDVTPEQIQHLCLAAIERAEAESSHPIGAALKTFAAKQLSTATPSIQLLCIKETPGRGLFATFTYDDSQTGELWLGNAKYLHESGIDTEDQWAVLQADWEDAAKTVVLAALRVTERSPAKLVARFAVADPPRPEAERVIGQLCKQYRVMMLSGDSRKTALAVARQVGISEDNVVAGVLPEGKADYIAMLQNETEEVKTTGAIGTLSRMLGVKRTRKRHVVLFVGDGLNDTVALKQADVAVAMSHGSQATLASADFVLLHSNLASITTLLKISRKVYSRQKLNLTWAFIFNAICIPFAAGTFYFHNRIKLPPVWAALAMALSSTSVVMSSLALKWGL